MPGNTDGFYQESDCGLTVIACAPHGDDRRAHLCLAGEMDMTSAAVLSDIADWLAALMPVSVLVDLAELTFASSALPNFLVRVHLAVPDTELILWRAGPAIEWVLRATRMAAIATIRTELAEPFAVRA